LKMRTFEPYLSLFLSSLLQYVRGNEALDINLNPAMCTHIITQFRRNFFLPSLVGRKFN
jgi:hypothetical protein